MIINSINCKKIKILIDEYDLIKAGFSPEKWISNSNQISSYIKNLLKSNSNLLDKLDLKEYLIFTYNYKVFSIIILL